VTVLHIVSILSILSGLAIGFFRLHAGLLILTFFGPFFTLLHEMSPGSPVYFLWPFALCGVMVLSIICREAFEWNGPISARKRTVCLLWCAGLLTTTMLGIVWAVDGFRTVFSDVNMVEFPKLLGNRNMALFSTVMSLVLLLFLGVYFREMRRREGRYRLLDFAVAALLIYGLFQVSHTALQSGVIFVGLDAFRYYFFMLIVYFLARYSIRHREHEKQLLVALGLACIVGAVQVMAEGYALNILQISPEDMPWVGHLRKNWHYLPEGDRSFFEGGYRPLGLMYMTHFTGLFLLLGLALWIPRLLTARLWKDMGLYLIPVLFLLLATFWTSRTVLLLLIGIYAGAAVLMRVSSPRILVGGVALTLFCLFSSYNLLPVLPGFRYDLVKEAQYVALSAVPDNVRAIATDWLAISGRGRLASKDVTDESPPGWRFFPGSVSAGGSGPYTKRVSHERIFGNYGLAIGSGFGSRVWIRRVLIDTKKLRRKEIIVGAWIKATAPRLAWLRVEEYFGPPTESAYYSGSGEWEFVTVKHSVQQFSDEIRIDVNVRHTNQENDVAFVDGVYLVALGKVITLMSRLSGFPWERFPGLTQPNRPGSETISLRRDLLLDREPSLQSVHHLLLGRGASLWGWSVLFFPEEREKENAFVARSYSDFKYLEFIEQFGGVGLLLLLTMGVFSIARGIHLSWKERDRQLRATFVGLTLIVIIGFAAMFHLPSLFKVGINSIVYMVIAMLMRES
jgi:hypothetical protein